MQQSFQLITYHQESQKLLLKHYFQTIRKEWAPVGKENSFATFTFRKLQWRLLRKRERMQVYKPDKANLRTTFCYGQEMTEEQEGQPRYATERQP